ncbi:lytic transglycosylase domain-containing protein [Paraburkholderia aspalathi]|uniref:glycoside hydrolase family 19 protein n=1 Tax=Paraburkholderia aspalathi TaxID=1324617 RepID=UPI0038BA8DA4
MTAQTHPHPAPAPTPTSAPPGPTSATTPLTWRYPFPDKDYKEVTSPQTFYQALAGMDDGFFPLGVNGFPHGGIHLNNSVGMFGTKDGVRCIADGYIVAYKIDDAYPHLQFKDGKWAMYSTGFVLVRHRLTLPPAPNSTGVQPADESHDIYSLYMHTADWATYLADEKLKRPWWWLNVDAFRVQGRDRQMAAPKDGTTGAAGAFVWTEPKAGKKPGSFTAGERVGFLPEGSEIIASETRGQWVHIKRITAGHMTSPVNGGYFGGEDENVPWKTETNNSKVTPENDWGWLYKPNLKGIKEPDPVGQVVIPPAPVFVKAGTPLGQIGEYHDYERATPLPPVPKRQLLHLEVFADDSFSAFLDKSRARAAQFLRPDQLPLLVINAGAKLVKDVLPADRKLCEWRPLYRADVTPDSPASGPWVKVQPRYQDSTTTLLMPEGAPVWIERENLATATATTPAWTQFPLSLQKVADPANAFTLLYSRSQLDGLSAREKAVDDAKTQWWRVKFGDADGHPASGWVCEKKHPDTQWQSPWAWPGFEKVDATGIDLADAFRRNLVLTSSADWKEQTEFEPSVAAVNGSPLLLKLEQTIAKLAPPPSYGASSKPKENPAGKVTAKAMQAAMRTPWLAQALSRVILRYESEWGGDMSRWNAITPLMRNAKDNWLVELQRIHELQWWNDVKGKVAGFPVSATVHHIHPIALVANFMCNCGCIDIDKFLQAYEAEHVAFEAGTQPLDDASKNNLRIFIQGILDYYKKYKNGECNIAYIAYMLGTARLETKKYHANLHKTIYFEPTTEGGPIPYFNKYDPVLADTAAHRQRALDNGNAHQGDGYKYRGRGYVQVTWRNNYRAIGQVIGIDLANNPDRMLEPEIAAWATVYGMENGIFTGRRLSNYISEATQDYVNARRIINGLDQADKIAGFAIKFKIILEGTRC